MDRLRFVVWVSLLLVIPGVFSTTTFAQADPHIVVILADDLGYGDVRVYNDSDIDWNSGRGWAASSRVVTPSIDQLAGEGMRFTNAHSGT
ncbi:MAG: hypothetical protein WBG86_21535, partial [Polyangiales bacterium]